jgi:uncharacterized protein (DUF2141 family)
MKFYLRSIYFFSSFFLFGFFLITKPGFTQIYYQQSISKPIDIRPLLQKDQAEAVSTNEATYSITITVTNIRSRSGVIRFKFYDDKTRFPHDTGFLRIVVPKTSFEGDTFTASYTGFVSKNMAVALSDDENNNVELDMGWFYPIEGHAFSDYFHTAFRRPVYEDFDFFLNADRNVVMKVRYY